MWSTRALVLVTAALSLSFQSACFSPVADEPVDCQPFEVTVPIRLDDGGWLLDGLGHGLWGGKQSWGDYRVPPGTVSGLSGVLSIDGRVLLDGLAAVVSLDGGVGLREPVPEFSDTPGVDHTFGRPHVVHGSVFQTFSRFPDAGQSTRQYGIAELSEDLLRARQLDLVAEIAAPPALFGGQVLRSGSGRLGCHSYAGWLGDEGHLQLFFDGGGVEIALDATCFDLVDQADGGSIALLRTARPQMPLWRTASIEDGEHLGEPVMSWSCRFVQGAEPTTVACTQEWGAAAGVVFFDQGLTTAHATWPARPNTEILFARTDGRSTEIALAIPDSEAREHGTLVLMRDGRAVAGKQLGLPAAATRLADGDWMLVSPDAARTGLTFHRWCAP
jgi:hypothetical protein